MMPYVTATLMVDADVLPDPDRVPSPARSRVLAVGKRSSSVPDGHGSESAAAVLDDGDPSADAVSGLRRLRGAVRVCDGLADHAAAGRRLDPHHTALDAGHLDVPGTGVLLGAGWAYAVLGWGGYWGWDPVENASLLPWITATAFLHSVMMQEKKGMMKVWNMVLVSATFFLCIFGTFLTRCGVVSSVHAFAQSPIGTYFVTFLVDSASRSRCT